jgi:putative spermidine/putrescine transport system substrate-binding protein
MKMKKTTKKVLSMLLVFMLAFSVVGCNNAEEPAEEPAAEEPAAPAEKIGEGRTLVVGVWGGPQEDLIRNNIIGPFEEETGASVELVLGGSSDRFARLYAETDNPTMDVMYVGLDQTMQAAADGVITEPNPAGVPEYANLYEQAKTPGAYGVAFMSIGIMYNTDMVETAPTAWADLWKPEYAGKVAPFVFPGTQGTAFLAMAAKINGGSESDMGPGFEALKELKPFPSILSGVDETNLGFKEGDIWFAPQIHGYVYKYQDEGGPVGFVLPEEGAPLAVNSAVIPVNSKNADLAEIFINIHLGQATQEAYAKELYYAPTNKTVVLDEALAAKMPYGEEEVGQLLMLDSKAISEQATELADRWNREIIE